MTEKKRKCFNCKSGEAMTRPLFCDDCWRMAIIMSAVGGSGSEALHRLVEFFFK